MVNTMYCYFGSFLGNFEEIENERLNSRCTKQSYRTEILKCIVLEKLILSFSLWALGEFDTFLFLSLIY